jgi:BirA family transcriptional regulator, biotin operon repressor / biotin---[acetyl-CoA-carboxylase] ligase
MNPIPHDTIVLEVVDSTNTWAKKNLASLSQDKPTCIIARSQTKGRGRYGQTWFSPKDLNLYFTLAEKVTPALSLIHYAEAATLAIQTALWDWQLPSSIKWPNDVLVDNKKIAGVIVEEASQEGASWAILGIGLNVNMSKDDLLEIDRPATSMLLALGTHFPVEAVRNSLKEKLLELLAWAKNNPDMCHERWANACSWIIGKEITIHTAPYEKITGIAQQITSDGYLLVKTASGKIVPVASGHI